MSYKNCFFGFRKDEIDEIWKQKVQPLGRMTKLLISTDLQHFHGHLVECYVHRTYKSRLLYHVYQENYKINNSMNLASAKSI